MTRYFLRTLCALFLTGTLFTSPLLAADKGVILNFNEVDISTMVKFISDLTGKNFILDERVKGKISVYSPSKLTIDEAYNVFVSVLDLKGFTVVQSGKVAKIVPSASARQSGFPLLESGETLPVNENYIAQVTKLENITAQEALVFLQPMISKEGHISAFGPGNLILMVDSSINVRKLQGILKTIDTEQTREGLEIIYLKNASADSVAKTVQQWLAGSDKKPAGQTATGVVGSVLADLRLNALLVFGNENINKAVREMVAKLDVASPEASSKVNVYFLENTDATEMSKVLDGVVKGMVPVASAQPASSALDSGKVTITPDKASNSLVIMASTNDYNSLVQVIKKLDRRSKQVFVQVVIAEISLNKDRALGVQTAAVAGGVLGKYIAGGGFYDPFNTTDALLNASTAIGGLITQSLTSTPTSTTSTDANGTVTTSSTGTSGMSSPVNVVAMIKALETNGLVNILSTPNILTSDNKEAEISVGENVPFQGSATQSTIGTTTAVERRDIGINLKIKPQISEGDYIRMDISQEISAVKDSKGQAIDLVTTKRSAKTSIVVKDKETVIIGGLIQDQENESVSKVPLLGDIPGIGWLFKTVSKTRQKTNLMILLIPHIVRDNSDLAEISNEQKQKFGVSVKKVEPLDVQKEILGK